MSTILDRLGMGQWGFSRHMLGPETIFSELGSGEGGGKGEVGSSCSKMDEEEMT